MEIQLILEPIMNASLQRGKYLNIYYEYENKKGLLSTGPCLLAILIHCVTTARVNLEMVYVHTKVHTHQSNDQDY